MSRYLVWTATVVDNGPVRLSGALYDGASIEDALRVAKHAAGFRARQRPKLVRRGVDRCYVGPAATAWIEEVRS